MSKAQILSLTKLEQVKTLNEAYQEALIERGYEIYDFIETNIAPDKVVPNIQFAKTVYLNTIKTYLSDIKEVQDAYEEGIDVTIEAGEWVETVSESKANAFEIAILVLGTDDEDRTHEICTMYFRVIVR